MTDPIEPKILLFGEEVLDELYYPYDDFARINPSYLGIHINYHKYPIRSNMDPSEKGGIDLIEHYINLLSNKPYKFTKVYGGENKYVTREIIKKYPLSITYKGKKKGIVCKNDFFGYRGEKFLGYSYNGKLENKKELYEISSELEKTLNYLLVVDIGLGLIDDNESIKKIFSIVNQIEQKPIIFLKINPKDYIQKHEISLDYSLLDEIGDEQPDFKSFLEEIKKRGLTDLYNYKVGNNFDEEISAFETKKILNLLFLIIETKNTHGIHYNYFLNHINQSKNLNDKSERTLDDTDKEVKCQLIFDQIKQKFNPKEKNTYKLLIDIKSLLSEQKLFSYEKSDISEYPETLEKEQLIEVQKIIEIKRLVEIKKLIEYNNLLKSGYLIVFFNLQEMRDLGANIGYKISWEKTIEDTIEQLENNKKFYPIISTAHIIIIRIGLEGAIVIRFDENDRTQKEITLFFDKYHLEDELLRNIGGNVQGISTAFFSGFVNKIIKEIERKGIPKKCEYFAKLVNDYNFIFAGDQNLISEAVREGIGHSRRVWFWGYGMTTLPMRVPNELKLSINKCQKDYCLLHSVPDDLKNQDFDIKLAQFNFDKKVTSINNREPWTILKELKLSNIGTIAYDIIENGIETEKENKKIKIDFPIYKLGDLVTVDRSEIESYQSIKNIISVYIDSDKRKKPLSIAVFGPPGSGKSFGIEEIAKSLSRDKIFIKTYNLSQFNQPEQLNNVFHEISDIVLSGSIPLVFFDEFDSELKRKLGWLKYFLSPMQDGVFYDGRSLHPIGKSIFVFAGGVYKSFEDFSKTADESDGPDLKISDFLSRLRGHINIIGCNKTDLNDDFYKIRRAINFRYRVKKDHPELFIGEKMNIAESVQRAFVKTTHYCHGNRSMEALINISDLKERVSFGPSSLAMNSQMDQHVDSEIFINLVQRDIEISQFIESVQKNNNYSIHFNNNGKIEKFTKMDTWKINTILDREQYGFIKRTKSMLKLFEFSQDIWNLIKDDCGKSNIEFINIDYEGRVHFVVEMKNLLKEYLNKEKTFALPILEIYNYQIDFNMKPEIKSRIESENYSSEDKKKNDSFLFYYPFLPGNVSKVKEIISIYDKLGYQVYKY